MTEPGAAPVRGSLTVVGTGITGVGQTTLEAEACIKAADIVYYSVIEPTTEYWLRHLNPNAISFAGLYGDGKDRGATYDEMIDRLVASARSGLRVCAAFYGHPGILVHASHRAIAVLRREGYEARMLPGVSAEGCLYADLGIDPGDVGMQSFEATEFLLSNRRIDPSSGLILWQVGVLGERTARPTFCRPDRLKRLADTLAATYPPGHEVVLYYAATFPANPPTIERLPLETLPRASVAPLAMLYVPPFEQREPAADVLRWLDEA